MQKIRLKLKAYDHRVLDRSVLSIVSAVKRSGSEIVGPIPLPTRKRRYTVLRSPHVNKDSREQFEIRIHSRIIDIMSATGDTVDNLMKLDLAPEVDVEVMSMKGSFGFVGFIWYLRVCHGVYSPEGWYE